ncbi:sensor histidine kinase, partial [Streptomyces sp. SID11233]|nr:sensor histidine kinase [Streptomyces sp. SID11233]
PVREIREGRTRFLWVRWLPQGCVGLAALVCFFVIVTGPYGFTFGLAGALLVTLAMFRPIGAWWLSLPLCLIPASSGAVSLAFGPAFLVMVIAGWLSPPRTAFTMWVVSAVLSLGLSGALDWDAESN